jgi:CRP-like cAMP-binding protein
MSEAPSPRQNHLLAALNPEVQARLFPHLELVPLPLGKVLYESGDAMRHVYFPTDSIVSLLYVMESGASAEISVVGNEGLIGVALFMGGESTPSRAIVQSAGSAYRLLGQRLKDEFNRHGDLLLLMLRYTQSLITQMAQTAVCNRHHSVDQYALLRVRSWTRDRLRRPVLLIAWRMALKALTISVLTSPPTTLWCLPVM